MIFGLPLLSVAIWVPIVFGVLVLFSGSDRNAGAARVIALVGAVLGFVVTIPLYTQFSLHQHGMQFVEFTPWIQTFNINYHLGIDGLSLLLILLNSFTTILVVIAGWKVIQSRVAQYMASFLFLSGLMNGAFSALDAILFYVFFEATLIPMFIIIGVWGGPNRIYSALKFFLYTFFGSVLFLVALIYLYVVSGGSFALYTYYHLPLSLTAQILIFLAFMSAFAVKLPMWPVHTWLPDAHVEAPTGGSVVLAAVMLKLGGYGFLRLSLPIAPDASHYLSPLMITLSLIAIVYIGLVALVQSDMKKLIAYSSVAHMGFVTLGYFIFNAHGMEGAIIQMISHGFISGALFLCIGVMYDRLHTRQISDYGGLINRMPVFATLFMLFAMANCGLPGTSGFVGEFLVVMGSMKHSFWVAVAAASTLIWAAGYSLWLYKRVVFGAVGNARVETMADLNLREFIVLGLLAVAVLALGVYPDPFAAVLHTPVHDLLALVSQSKLPVQ
ncbi:MAG TPA: NADH-quinone oxidoreductase subunit M [Burkholderiales bacterium]|jgi:NADH-quinone oxidoreductase subunit M|nr:NADH-quinone oxidoreductase subunit M [Burkholderiales bacterium]